MIKTFWFYIKEDFISLDVVSHNTGNLKKKKHLTFDIIHLRRGDHWFIGAIRLAVLTIALRIRLQNQT